MFSLRDLDRKYRVAFFTTILVVGFVYFYYNQGPVKLLTFVAGILLYEAISGGRVNKVPLIGLLAVVIMFFFIIYAIDNGINPWIRNLIVCFSFVFLCYESFTTTGFVNKLFRLKYLRWLGNMSYSYYLVHVLSMKALFLVFERIYPHNADGTYLFYYLLPVAFAATIVFSMVLYALVEKPYSLDNKPIPFMYWPKMK